MSSDIVYAFDKSGNFIVGDRRSNHTACLYRRCGVHIHDEFPLWKMAHATPLRAARIMLGYVQYFVEDRTVYYFDEENWQTLNSKVLSL